MGAEITNVNELVDYEDDYGGQLDETVGESGDVKKGSYAGIHSIGFRDLLLKPELLHAIADCGFEHPSEVQQECIPQAVLGTDLLCQAKSGMGKTAVFVLATLQQIDSVIQDTTVLVLVPTRELAFQIKKEFERFLKYMSSIRVELLSGGYNFKDQCEMLKKEQPHIIVGTPGRIQNLLIRKKLNLSKLSHFVLDECDKMLDQLDMRNQVQYAFVNTPHEKQVMMFSATLNKTIREVCKQFMREPVEICVDNEAKLTLHGLRQHYVKLSESEKTKKLCDLLDLLEFNQVVVFVKSTVRAQMLSYLLNKQAFPCICIHGDLSQPERVKRYQDFKSFHVRIVTTTDLLSRGIDVERVNIVFNYDMPESADTYLHRVARCGRFGTKGLAITFVSSQEDGDILNKVQERFEVNVSELPSSIDISSYMTV